MELFRLTSAPERAPPNDSSVGRQHDANLRLISLSEVAWHDTPDDCWLVINDYVYDCTDFVKRHPGGAEVLLEYAGRDATLAFVGAGHTKKALQMLGRYVVGELPFEEKIFRRAGGIRIVQEDFLFETC